MRTSILIPLFTVLVSAQTIDIAAVKLAAPAPTPSFAVGVQSQVVTYNAPSAVAAIFAAVKLAANARGGAGTGTIAKRAGVQPVGPETNSLLWGGYPPHVPIPTSTTFEPKLHKPHHTSHPGPEPIGPEPAPDRMAKRQPLVPERGILAARSLSACQPEPTGAGPLPSPDTPAGWAASPKWANQALAATTPSNYQQTFVNLNASNIAYGYLGYQYINAYNPNKCANLCDAMTGCTAFNLYFERDPCLTPGAACMDPEATTTIKCAFWGGQVSNANAINYGQYRESFHVLIGGSNGYSRTDGCTNPVYPGYSQPEYLGNSTILAQPDCNGVDSYLGVEFFTSGPFDYNLCAAACSALSQSNLAKNPTAQTCQFFTTYILYENGNALGQYCAMYSEYWSDTFNTNLGQWDGQGNHYTISNSYSSYNLSNPGYANPRCSWQGVPTQNVACAQSTASPSSATSAASSSSSSWSFTVKMPFPTTVTTISTGANSPSSYGGSSSPTKSLTTSTSITTPPGYGSSSSSTLSITTAKTTSSPPGYGASSNSIATTSKTGVSAPPGYGSSTSSTTSSTSTSSTKSKATSTTKSSSIAPPNPYGGSAATAAAKRWFGM